MATTEYVILRDSAGGWTTLSQRYKGSSPTAAIRAAAELQGTGEYVAIPARSWQPREVVVAQKTSVTFAKEEAS